MGDYKFDTFYYLTDKSNEHYLSEIEDLSDDDYRRLYKGKMYCPWCEGPQLSLVKKEGISYLRTYPKQPHVLAAGEMCHYECDTASKTVVGDYVQELRKRKKIKSILEAAMRKLFKDNALKNNTSGVMENKPPNPLLIKRVKPDGTVKKNIIPHYNFKSWGKNIPQDQLLIVYGKVYIELYESDKEEGNDKTCYTYIHFCDVDTRKLITSCIKPPNLVVKKDNYYAVILGKCRLYRTNKGTMFYNIWVNSPVEQSILLKESPSS